MGNPTLGCWTNSCCTLTQAKGNICTVSIPSLSGAYAEAIDRVFAQMETVECHVYQVLTKRSLRMRDYLKGRYAHQAAPPPHIWCGVSVEDHRVSSRIRHLSMATVSVRFLSLEPLLGPLRAIDLEGISWVIVGGESGPHARPLQPEWVRQVRDQCAAAAVPFFFKQWDGHTPKAGGRLLEGVEYNGIPLMESNRGILSMAS